VRAIAVHSIWTDMSEIVRPTRDGIHGREYISTSVDVGHKPMRLSFAPDGRMLTDPAHLLEIQIPAILDVPPWPMRQSNLARARAEAARELKTVTTVFAREAMLLPQELRPFSVPIIEEDIPDCCDETWKMVQLVDGKAVLETAARIRSMNPETILSVRMPLDLHSADRIIELCRHGMKVFHLCADLHGCERAADSMVGRHMKDSLREIHSRLVNEGLRDEVTLIISGGIALAEHMAKAIICGADLVAVDAALLVALGCRVCRDARDGHADNVCPAAVGAVDSEYAAQRIVNLMGAWHSQMIEVLGAMGIREVRRLRGEMGRAIFMEEIEKEAFGDLIRVPREQASA
jgi:hypothetical protein